MAKGVLIAGAVLLVAGGAALGYALTRKAVGGMTAEQHQLMDASVAKLEGDIDGAHISVRQRAKTMLEFDLVFRAVGTDAVTTRDLVGRELKTKPDVGEVIEIGQIAKPAGQPVPLIVLPEGGMRSSKAGIIGEDAELKDDQLLVTKTVDAPPSDPDAAKQFNGYVTVSKVLDLKPAIKGLVDAGITGSIQVGANKVNVGTPPATGQTETAPLKSLPNASVTAVVPPPHGGMPVPIAAAGGGAALLGLVLMLIGMMGGRDKTGLTQMGMQPMAPPNAATGMSTGMPGQSMGMQQVTNTNMISGPSLSSAEIGPGALIGRWEIVRRLGSGGMADVYLARAHGEAGFQKLVAIKIMHSHLARNQRAVDHFLDEARLAARVVHPNVVAIQDLGKIGNDYVIVMDYVEGVDLERMLANARLGPRPVPMNVGLGILCRICDGLNAAHRAVAPDGTPMNIIHRDVKSANVLISKQGGVKVVDFGIAKAATQSHMTVAGETKGTPSMMAPEQRVGEQVDVRADVYSVAAVAYETLTGHAVNLDLAALAHLGVENWPHLPPPSQLRPDLPPELDKILLSAMAFERDRRPADCAAFETTLEAVMKNNNLSCSDKDIARWAEAEMRYLNTASPDGTAATAMS